MLPFITRSFHLSRLKVPTGLTSGEVEGWGACDISKYGYVSTLLPTHTHTRILSFFYFFFTAPLQPIAFFGRVRGGEGLQACMHDSCRRPLFRGREYDSCNVAWPARVHTHTQIPSFFYFFFTAPLQPIAFFGRVRGGRGCRPVCMTHVTGLCLKGASMTHAIWHGQRGYTHTQTHGALIRLHGHLKPGVVVRLILPLSKPMYRYCTTSLHVAK